MHPIWYYIIFLLCIGAIGMAIANRNVEPVVRRKRWLKYFMYILITGTVVAGILYDLFYGLAWIISVLSLFELIKVNLSKKTTTFPEIIISLITFLVVAAGFLLFAHTFRNPFLLFIYFQVLVFDGFCQISGQLFGRHPLVPKISPSKTTEGLIGGWICCMAAAMMSTRWIPLPLYVSLLFGLFTGLTCFTGDLLASWYKRKVKVKDYSNWLPGQGGFLDRFDSFLLTAAVYYLLYITIFKVRFDLLVKS